MVCQRPLLASLLYRGNQAKPQGIIQRTATVGAQEGLISVQLVSRDRNAERNQIDIGGKRHIGRKHRRWEDEVSICRKSAGGMGGRREYSKK